MKRTNLILVLLLIVSSILYGQEKSEEFKPAGKAFGKVFWNYHYNGSEGADQKNTFELQRAYLGYKYKFSKVLSANITLDGARTSDASDYTVFLKKAQLDWQVASPVKLQMGLIGLKQFDTQEKLWGYRYLFKSFQDEFKLGSSADLGVNAEIKIIKSLKANVFVLNGEGYTNKQDNMGRMKIGGNLLFEPVEGLVFKAYYDIYGGKVAVNDSVTTSDTASVQTFSLFSGYKSDKFRVGAGFNYQKDGTKFNEIAANHDLFGWSVFGTYVINNKFEVFSYLLGNLSNTLEGEPESWNSNKDGVIVIIGGQYSPVKGVKMALNYRQYAFSKEGKNPGQYIYANFEFAF